MITDKDLEEGQTYDLFFTITAKGQGPVLVTYSARGIQSKKIKRQSLGLNLEIITKNQIQGYKCTFKVAKKKDPEMKGIFSITLSAFKGEVSIKDLKLEKSNHQGSLSPKGLIQEVDIKPLTSI